MNILFLSPGVEDQMLNAVAEHNITIIANELQAGYPYDNPDWVISYRYRHIIQEPFLSLWKGRMVNIHTSFLPHNRGASPNLWAWYDDTPHGVSIHLIDQWIDTGPLLYRKEIELSSMMTLETSYQRLQQEAGDLFQELWPSICDQKLMPIRVRNEGSFHSVKQSKELLSKFRDKYQTKCWEVAKAGREARDGREASASVSAG